MRELESKNFVFQHPVIYLHLLVIISKVHPFLLLDIILIITMENKKHVEYLLFKSL